MDEVNKVYTQEEVNKLVNKVRKNTHALNRRQSLDRVEKLLNNGQISIDNDGNFVISPYILRGHFIVVDKYPMQA